MDTNVGLYRLKTPKGVRWLVRWYGDFNPATSKEKRYSKTFTRKVDAEQFRKTKTDEFKQGVSRDKSNETLAEYIDRWLRHKKLFEQIRPATVLLYEGTFRRLYDYFGPDCLLRNVSRFQVKEFLAGTKPKAERTEPLSAWSHQRILRQCKTLFAEAVKEGVIAVNPFADIAGPKCTPSDWYYLKHGEFHKLLEVAPTLREKVLYVLAFTAGLRESEALALYWTNIDFDKARVHITNRPATKDYPPFHVKDNDARVIPLPEFTVKLLTQLHSETTEGVPFVLMDKQDDERIRNKWQQCCQQDTQWLNRYWSKNNIIRDFKRRIKQAGINQVGKKLTVHILRKCCIQNWANTLPMNVVKELAGHSSIETTNRFYSTVDDAQLEAAARETDRLLTPDRENTFDTQKRQKTPESSQ